MLRRAMSNALFGGWVATMLYSVHPLTADSGRSDCVDCRTLRRDYSLASAGQHRTRLRIPGMRLEVDYRVTGLVTSILLPMSTLPMTSVSARQFEKAHSLAIERSSSRGRGLSRKFRNADKRSPNRECRRNPGRCSPIDRTSLPPVNSGLMGLAYHKRRFT